MASKLNKNQIVHFLLWLIFIFFIELLLFLLPVREWIILVITGTAFIAAFILRLSKHYPGKEEPLIVDLLSGLIGFIMILPFIFADNFIVKLMLKAISPFFILIPHFIYIARNKKIHPPIMVNIIKKLNRKKKYW
jgi:hypothetical protein